MNYDYFLVFVLGHLVGDFVLQTDRIAKLKAISKKGLLIHCMVVTITQAAFLSVFGLRGFFAGLLCGLVHFFIDYLKTGINKYLTGKQFTYFIIDQVIHLSLIYALTLFFAPSSNFLNSYQGYIKVVIALIVVTYSSTVAAKILVRDLVKSQADRVFFKRYERIIDAVVAVALFSVWLLPMFLSLLLLIAAFYPYYRLQKSAFSFETKITLIKYLTFSIVSFMAGIIVFK